MNRRLAVSIVVSVLLLAQFLLGRRKFLLQHLGLRAAGTGPAVRDHPLADRAGGGVLQRRRLAGVSAVSSRAAGSHLHSDS